MCVLPSGFFCVAPGKIERDHHPGIHVPCWADHSCPSVYPKYFDDSESKDMNFTNPDMIIGGS